MGSEDGKTQKSFVGFSTLAIHEGQEPEQWQSLAVVPPITLSTTYKQDGPGKHRGFEYGRSGNPTRVCLEKCIAALEDGKYCSVFGSGLAATMTLTQLLNSGDHIISCDDVYGGTNRYFQRVLKEFAGIQATFVNANDADNIGSVMQPNTGMVWIESPTNPTLAVIDVAAVVKMVKDKNSKTLVVVDNTFMTPYFQRPLALGADIVLHSLTKYMNGHSDVVMGAVITNSKDVAERIGFLQYAVGAVPSPFDCYLVNRGLKTLAVRMKEHHTNGLICARFLEEHPLVDKVLHPGLESHPQYKLAMTQSHGFSGMVSFYIKGGLKEAEAFLKACKVFILAESLGGFESLCEHPALMTHASVPAEQRVVLGIGDNLIRLSVGLEDAEDLVADLDQALKASADGNCEASNGVGPPVKRSRK